MIDAGFVHVVRLLISLPDEQRAELVAAARSLEEHARAEVLALLMALSDTSLLMVPGDEGLN